MSIAETRPKVTDDSDHGQGSRQRKSRRRESTDTKDHGESLISIEQIWESGFGQESQADPWSSFDDLTRIDPIEDEEVGAFSDFEPISLETETNATEDHDLVL